MAHHNRDTIAIHSGLVFQKKWVWNSRVLLPFTSATATSWKMDQWIRIWIRILVLDSASMKNILSEARNGKKWQEQDSQMTSCERYTSGTCYGSISKPPTWTAPVEQHCSPTDALTDQSHIWCTESCNDINESAMSRQWVNAAVRIIVRSLFHGIPVILTPEIGSRSSNMK